MKRLAVVAAWGVTIAIPLWMGLVALRPERPQPGEKPIVLANQARHDFRMAYCDAICRAKKSVTLVIFALSDKSLIEALSRKAREGVSVSVYCDRKASEGLALALGPSVTTTYVKSRGLMHQKILVVDDEEVWIGSANMTPESLRHHGNSIAAFHSAAVGAFVTNYAEAMRYGTLGQVSHAATFTVAGQQMEMYLLPDEGVALRRLLQVINSAKKTLRIAMFTWTHPELLEAVLAAHRRGVAVHVVMDYNSAQGASHKIYTVLQDAGVDISMNDNGVLLHHKTCVVDDKTLVLGSLNWTQAAFTQNNDCFIILHGITRAQKSVLDAMWDVVVAESR